MGYPITRPVSYQWTPPLVYIDEEHVRTLATSPTLSLYTQIFSAVFARHWANMAGHVETGPGTGSENPLRKQHEQSRTGF